MFFNKPRPFQNPGLSSHSPDKGNNNDKPRVKYSTMEVDPEMIQLMTRIFFAVTREFINFLENKSVKPK